MWFRDKPPPKDLSELIQRNLGRSNEDTPAVRMPAPAETKREPMGPTRPLKPVQQSPN